MYKLSFMASRVPGRVHNGCKQVMKGEKDGCFEKEKVGGRKRSYMHILESAFGYKSMPGREKNLPPTPVQQQSPG